MISWRVILIPISITLIFAGVIGCAQLNALAKTLQPDTSTNATNTTNTSSSNSNNTNVTNIPGLLLWNKLGSDADITTSAFGFPLSNAGGLAYAAGYFGNGIRTAMNTWAEFQTTNLVLARGTIEFWVLPEAGLATGGTKNFFFGTTSNATGVNLCYFVYNEPNIGDLTWAFGSWSVTVGTTFTTGTQVHLACVWDNAGIGGSEKYQIYKNGVKIASSTTNVLQAMGTDIRMRLGNCWDNNGRYLKGVMDNVKIWNYAKTNFSDRFTE